jgi:SpoVK/Ycf46/Vps4 family AAA+-type ATPase
MSSETRFLNELFRIVNGALRLDIDKVRNYTAFLADNLEKSGDVASAERLRKMLADNDHQLRPTGATMAAAVPVDTETRFPLLEKVEVRQILEPPLYLPQPQLDSIWEFISVAKSHSQLEAHGISTSLALLMHGPPGCGKSRLARFISKELGLSLYIARLDGLISSFLGSTSKNIRTIFEFASKTPCVLFLDEFDAIAKLRDDTQELGEIKRVVNSFLQNLDMLGTQSVVLAATNHAQLLDKAVWRRFNYRIELAYPDSTLRSVMWRSFLAPITWSDRFIELLTDLSEGFSGGDIQEICARLKRKKIAANLDPQLHDAFVALAQLAGGDGEQSRFMAKVRNVEPEETSTMLRTKDSKLYSHANVAALLGVSKATAYRWAGEKTDAKR